VPLNNQSIGTEPCLARFFLETKNSLEIMSTFIDTLIRLLNVNINVFAKFINTFIEGQQLWAYKVLCRPTYRVKSPFVATCFTLLANSFVRKELFGSYLDM